MTAKKPKGQSATGWFYGQPGFRQVQFGVEQDRADDLAAADPVEPDAEPRNRFCDEDQCACHEHARRAQTIPLPLDLRERLVAAMERAERCLGYAGYSRSGMRAAIRAALDELKNLGGERG